MLQDACTKLARIIKGDVTTAEEQFSFNENALEDAVKQALSEEEATDRFRSETICRMLQIDYDLLPEDQQKALDSILRGSPLMKAAADMDKKAPLLQNKGRAKKKTCENKKSPDCH